MFRLMQPADMPTLKKLWSKAFGDGEEQAEAMILRFAGEKNTYVAEEGGAEVHVYLFWSASCPHCLAARPQVQALAAARPWVVLHDLELGADPTHGERYEAMAAELGEEALAVPALFYCGRMEVGWDDGGDSAARLAQALDACRAGATRLRSPRRFACPGWAKWMRPACRCRCTSATGGACC